MATLCQSNLSGPIRGQLRVQSSSCCNRCHHHNESTPKVLAITKPEEKWKQAKKGTTYD